MRKFSILFLLTVVVSCESNGQESIPSGTFERTFSNGELSGQLLAYPETDSTALIYIYVTRGAPSYNSGSLYARMITNSSGTYLNIVNDDLNCQLELKIQANYITITTEKQECGFGYGVVADGTFKLKNSETPEFFETMEGTKVYFSKIAPEEYNN
ncbi:MAG: hypothetical protein JXQ96_07470 [Cyclobacteriaceae bacterium]